MPTALPPPHGFDDSPWNRALWERPGGGVTIDARLNVTVQTSANVGEGAFTRAVKPALGAFADEIAREFKEAGA